MALPLIYQYCYCFKASLSEELHKKQRLNSKKRQFLAIALLIEGIAFLSFSLFFAIYKSEISNLIFLSIALTLLCFGNLAIYIGNKQWFIEHPVRVYLLGLLFFFILIIPLGIYWGLDYKNDVLVEAHGLLFDLLVFGILLAIYDKIKSDEEERKKEEVERKLKVELHLEEIDDFRRWKSEEAKFRVRGNILRLNKLDHSKIDLAELDLSKLDLKEVKLNHSNLFQTDFSSSNLANAEFKEIICSNSKFNKTKTFLLNAKFQNSHLQYCEFIESYLNGADFTDAKLSNIDFCRADLRNVIFKRTYFYDPNLSGAEVNEDFIENLKKWDIQGHPIYDWYEVVKQPAKGHPGHFQFFLQEKPDIDKSIKIGES